MQEAEYLIKWFISLGDGGKKGEEGGNGHTEAWKVLGFFKDY